MDRLRGLFEDLDFDEVSTVLASGNVIFTASSSDAFELRQAVERQLERHLGYEVETFLRRPDELAAISEFEPPEEGLSASATVSHYVVFLHDAPPDSLQAELAALQTAADVFHFAGREVHWRIGSKLSESPLFGGPFDRAVRGIPNTVRNINTVRKLAAKTVPPDGI